jgi:HAD superfamily hydrolase (TIGR01509 family)
VATSGATRGYPMLPRRPEAVVLDMDGTLLDTEAIYVGTFEETAAALGHPLPTGLLHSLIGMPGASFQSRLREALGTAFPYAEHRDRYVALRTARLAEGVPLKPGAIDLLDEIAALGLGIAIATAATRVHAEDMLRRGGLRERFAVVLTRDDVANSKPEPDLFLCAAVGIGIAPGLCLAVEDSHNGVRAAHAAGMMTVMVPDIVPANAEMLELCIAVVDDLHAVRMMLRDQRLPG